MFPRVRRKSPSPGHGTAKSFPPLNGEQSDQTNFFAHRAAGGIVFLDVLSLRHKTLTYDEKRHYRYGLKILEVFSIRGNNPTVMPITALNVIPRKIGDIIPDGTLKTFLRVRSTGRYVTILFSLLIAAFIFWWTKSLYGSTAAFFSLILYILSPNIIAHSRLITTDLYATGMLTLSLYCFWRFINKRGWKWGLLSATTGDKSTGQIWLRLLISNFYYHSLSEIFEPGSIFN